MTPLLLLFALATTEVVARVNGETVTAADVAERAAAARAAGSRQGLPQLVEDLVNEAVLAEDGARAGLDRDPRVRAAGDAAARRAAAELFVEEAARAVAPASDAELRNMFHDVADSVHLQAVVVATRGEAEAILERLAKGGRFADEARQSLDSAAAARGGDRGLEVRAQLDPALATLAFSAPLGVPSGPVELSLGWGVIVVAERTVGDDAAFARRKDEIARYAQTQQRAAVRGHLAEQLRRKAGVTVDEEFVRASGTRLDGGELDHVIARAGGGVVRYRDVLERVRRLAGGRQGGHFTGPSVKLELCWAAVDELLFAETGVARGLDAAPAALAARRKAERAEVVRVAAARLRDAVPVPTNDELRAYYREHLPEFLRPARRAAYHILVREREQADKLRVLLQRGASWDELAAEHSLDGASAGKGGAIGVLDDRQLDALAAAGEPGLAAALRDTRAGQVAGPLKSRAGWHLLRTDRAQPATVLAPEVVAKDIAARLVAERQDRAVRARLAALRAAATVDIDAAALRRLEKEPTP